MKDYFGANGDGNDLTVWVQTAGGSVSFPARDFGSAGGNYVNFAVPSGAAARIAGIGAGDRFILALTPARSLLRPRPRRPRHRRHRPSPTPTPSPFPTPTTAPSPSPSPTAAPHADGLSNRRPGPRA